MKEREDLSGVSQHLCGWLRSMGVQKGEGGASHQIRWGISGHQQTACWVAFVCVSDNCCVQDANMSGIGTAASNRNLSLTEELERLEQSITLTLQGMLIS